MKLYVLFIRKFRNFSIYLNQSQSYKFFKQYIENPVIEWEITVFDYFGQKTVKSQQFMCVEILDLDAPVINSIENPSIFSDWTGGFNIVLNTTDYDSNVFIDTDDWADSSGTSCSVIGNETYLTEQYNFKFDDQSGSEMCLVEREYFNLTRGYYSFRIATTDSSKEFNIKLLEDMDTRINLRLYLGELQSYNGTDWNFVTNITNDIFYFVQISWYNTDNSTFSISVDDLYVGDFVLESEIISHINFASLSTGITDSDYQVYVNRLHFDNTDLENEPNTYNPSEIRYVAVYVDMDPLGIPSQQDLFTPLVNSYYGETDPALANFLGYITEINVSDGLYYFNPWQIGEKFSRLTDGEHDFLVVVYDNNYNFAYTEFTAYIIVPELNIDLNTLMATSGTDKNLTLELIDYGDQVISVEFEIYDALTFTTASIPIDSITVYNTTNVTYSVTFSGILEKEYYLNYIITQTDGSIIERFHYCYLPEGVLTTLGYPDDYWYNEYNITISEGIPHDVTLSVQDGDIISGFFDLEVYWLGNGTVDQINVYLDEFWQYNIDDFIMIDNNSAHGLIPSDFISDGQYYLSVKVNFTNGQEGWSDPSVIIDNSPPEWISSGLWVDSISQFSLIDGIDGLVHVYTNDDLIINITAQDPHTNLTTMNCWIENAFGETIWSNNYTDGTEQFLDLNLTTSLSGFSDGLYYIHFNLTSGGGIITSQPICIHLDTSLPEGEFLTPDSSTIFGEDVITLEFAPESSIPNSLITHYDMNGDYEEYPEYTENTYPSTSPNYGFWINYGATATSISPTPYPMGLELHKPAEASAHATQGHYHGTWSNPVEALTTGEIYTVSFYARKTTENKRDFSIHLRESDWGVTSLTTISQSSMTPTYEWQRFYHSFTVDESVSAKVMIDWSYERNMTVQICGFQVEAKDHVTPFVTGIRYATVQDLEGGNDADLDINSPEWISNGRAGGGSYSFNGINELIITPHDFSELTTDYSVSVWVKPGSTQVQYADILGNHGGTYQGFVIQQDSNDLNKYYFAYGDGSNWILSDPIQLQSDIWQNIVIAVSGGQGYYYLDTILKDTFTCTTPMVPNTGQNLLIGLGVAVGDRYFNGEIDDIRIYSNKISNSEILQIYEADGVTENKITPVDSVEFYIQTDSTPITNYNMTINLNNVQDNLEFLGLSHERYNPYIQDYVYRLDYHQTDDLLIGSDKTFWAKLVDVAGNIQYIKTIDTHDIDRYYFELDNFDDVYYLEDGVNVSGTFNHYDADVPTGVDLSVKNGSTYISLNTDATYVNPDGTFQVNWTSNNLPAGLENAKIPISYLHFDNGEYFEVSDQNFAMYGNFMSNDSEIAFITLDNIRTMHIFKHETDTIYNWTRYDYSTQYSTNEALEAYAWDLDGDGLDEIVLITESSIIILDYNGVSFVKTEYTFDTLDSQFPIDLSSSLKFTHSPSNLIIANEFEIYSLFYNSTTPGFEYVTTIPLSEKINDLTYGTINNQDTLIIVSANEVLYYDYVQEVWISIFKTRYSLVNKIVVDNVDLDPESEILFGVYGYNGVDVVRADFDQELNQWSLMCAISYSEISTIYDLGSGHLMNNNYGYVVVASDLGIDMALIPYNEIEIELNADASHNMEDYYEQNGLYEYNELSEEATNWDDQTGELHYRSEGVSSKIGKSPISLDCPSSISDFTYGIRPTNFLDYDLNTLSESDSYSLIIENYEKRGDYTGYGDAIFSMGTDFLTDTKYLITFDFSLHFSDDQVELGIIDDNDDYQLIELDLDEGYNTLVYSGPIKQIHIKFYLYSEDTWGYMDIDKLTVSTQLAISAPKGYEIIPVNFAFQEDSTNINPNPIVTTIETVSTSSTQSVSRLVSPFTGSYIDGFESKTQSYFDSLSDFELSYIEGSGSEDLSDLVISNGITSYPTLVKIKELESNYDCNSFDYSWKAYGSLHESYLFIDGQNTNIGTWGDYAADWRYESGTKLGLYPAGTKFQIYACSSPMWEDHNDDVWIDDFEISTHGWNTELVIENGPFTTYESSGEYFIGLNNQFPGITDMRQYSAIYGTLDLTGRQNFQSYSVTSERTTSSESVTLLREFTTTTACTSFSFSWQTRSLNTRVTAYSYLYIDGIYVGPAYSGRSSSYVTRSGSKSGTYPANTDIAIYGKVGPDDPVWGSGVCSIRNVAFTTYNVEPAEYNSINIKLYSDDTQVGGTINLSDNPSFQFNIGEPGSSFNKIKVLPQFAKDVGNSKTGNLQKISVICAALSQVKSTLNNDKAKNLFEHAFDFNGLARRLNTISNGGMGKNIFISVYGVKVRADTWFNHNWMNYDIPAFASQRAQFEAILLDCYPSESARNKDHISKFLSTSNKITIKAFCDSMIQIGGILSISQFARKNSPFNNPLHQSNIAHLGRYYGKVLNALVVQIFGNALQVSEFYDNVNSLDNIQSFEAGRLSRLCSYGIPLRFHEILLMETMTKYLVNLLFDGDVSAFNAFNSKLAENDPDAAIQVYDESIRDKIDYTGIHWLSDTSPSMRFYFGTRTKKGLYVYQTNEKGIKIKYKVEADSFDEGLVFYQNYYYYDEQGNINFIQQDMRRETSYLKDLKKQNSKYNRFIRKGADLQFNKKHRKDFKKGMAGDFIRFLGLMYGKDALRSLYIENAGKPDWSYLKYKPFDLLGTRHQFHVPLEAIVPNGAIYKVDRERFKFGTELYNLLPPLHYENGNYREGYYSVGIPEGTTYLELYRDIMVSGDVHIFNNPAVSSVFTNGYAPSGGNWAPLFDHDMYAVISRARLMAGQGTDTFDGLLGFLEEIRNRDYSTASFDERWGLDENMARLIVESYGIDWIYGTINPLAQLWWNDFENCNNFYNDDARTDKNKYAKLAFYYIYQYLTDDEHGSQQLHLLFNPSLFFNLPTVEMTDAGFYGWDLAQAGDLATSNGEFWGDPDTEHHAGEFFNNAPIAHFDAQFFINQLQYWATIPFGLQPHILTGNEQLPTSLVNIWDNRPPSS